MPEQHAQFRQALGARRAHVVLVDLFEEQRAVPARRRPDAADHADQHRQDEELAGVQPAAVAGNRHQIPHLADQILAADDVEQPGNGHRRHAQHHAADIQRGVAEEHQQQRETDGDEQTEDEGRNRDGEAGPHAAPDFQRDVAAVVGATEVQREHAHRLVEQDGVGRLRHTRRGGIPHQRLVIAALGLPLLDRLRRHPLRTQLHARDVVRRIDDEEQQEGDQVHPDQDGNGIEQPADDVGDHRVSLLQAQARPAMRKAAPAASSIDALSPAGQAPAKTLQLRHASRRSLPRRRSRRTIP